MKIIPVSLVSKTLCFLFFIIAPILADAQIAAFPYSEGFETGFGAWNNVTGDDFDWTRNSGGTPSTGTGPSGANAGNWYLYTEASNPNNPSKNAYLEATFDFTGQTYPIMTFYYHMFGANMGTLYIDVNGTNVWSLSGQQQTSNGAAWQQAVVDLSAYANQSGVVVRFRGLTGSGWSSDIAIDDIAVCTINPGAASISTTTSCAATTVDLSLTGQDAGGTIQWQQSTDGVTYANIGGATTANYTTGVLPTGFTYYFRAVVTNGCSNYSNVVSVVVAAGTGTVGAFPYSEGFETGWGVWNNVTGDDFDWTRNTGGTPSGPTGPSAANQGSWYAYTEASNPNNPSKNAYLEASFDFTGQAYPMLTFYYHMYGANMGTLYVDVNGTNVWSLSGQQQTANADPWRQAVVDLSAYANVCNATIRFRGLTGGWSSDISIDDISICTVNPGTASISATTLCTGNTVNLSLTGQDAGATIQWQQSTDGGVTYSNIAGATTANYTTGVLTTGVTYSFRTVVTNGCSNYSNVVSVYVAPTTGIIGTFPYSEGFETGWGGWTNATTDDMNWTRNTGPTPSGATGPNAANQGSWYAYTESSTPNNPNKRAYLEATFDFSTTYSPLLSFYYHMYGGNMGTLYIDVNGTNVWSISGQQQASNGAAWKMASVDLSAYGGSCAASVRIRGVTGAGWASDISIDQIQVVEQSPLPVELLNFTAEYNDGVVNLDWITVTEINNDYFAVERSVDGINFSTIVNIEGVGNSVTTNEYHSVDKKPETGISYYRLKQVDFDGNYKYSNIIPVKVDREGVTLYPNPLNEKTLSIVMPGEYQAKTTIVIYNSIGEQVYGSVVQKQFGTVTFTIDLPNLTPGVYFVSGKNEYDEFWKKLIVK